MKPLIHPLRKQWLIASMLFASGACLIAPKLLAATDPNEPGNTGDTRPVVEIVATDAEAAEISPLLDIIPNPAVFTVRRTGASDVPLTVFYGVAGTASNGKDYTEIQSPITIPAGQASAEVVIDVIDDELAEGDETVELTLVLPPYGSPLPEPYVLGQHIRATAVIRDDEPPPPPPLPVVTIAATDAEAAEPDPVPAGTRPPIILNSGQFTIHRVGTTDEPLVVYFLVEGSATQGKDYADLGYSATIPANAASVTVDLIPLDDELVEGPETVSLRIVHQEILFPTFAPVPPTYEIGKPDIAVARILDNDQEPPPPTVLVPKGAVWKYFSAGTAPKDGWTRPDFDDANWHSGPAQLGFGDGDEATVIPSGNSAMRYITTYFRHTFEVADPTTLPGVVLELLRDDGAVVYLNGVEVRRDNLPAGPITYATLAVVAVGGSDESTFFPTPVPATALAAGRNVLAVEVHQSNPSSSDLSFDLSLRAGEGPVPPGVPPVVRVVAMDPEAAEVPPNANTPQNPGLFSIRREIAGPQALTVHYRLEGTAVNGADYEQLGNTATIPAGATAVEVPIRPIDDHLVEGTETVQLRLVVPEVVITVYPPPPPPYEIGQPGVAVVSVLDNDQDPNIRPVVNIVASDPEGREINPLLDIVSDPVSFTVTRTGDLKDSLNVFYGIGGSALNGVDYDQIHSMVTIAAGQDSAVIDINVLDDNLFEGDETVILTLVLPPTGSPLPDAYVLGQNVRATAVIHDDDEPLPPPRPVVTIVATDPEAAEPDPVPPGMGRPTILNAGEFTVRRDQPANAPLTVFYRIEGTAANGKDYDQIGNTVTIAAGETSARIAIIPIDDNLVEATETVHLRLVVPDVVITIYPPPPPPYDIGMPAGASVQILDNDTQVNHPPQVGITYPVSGAQFVGPANILVRAAAHDPDGTVQQVELFANQTRIGAMMPSSNAEGYVFEWRDVPVGEYVLTAVATDTQGASGTSAPVNVVVRERPFLVTRILPGGYAPGVAFTVTLQANPTPGVLAYAIADQPPAGWQVGAISHEGAFDSSFGQVKFGPFMDSQPRTLTYVLTPPTSATGVHHFVGYASYNGTTQPIAGANTIGHSMHPADNAPADWRLTMDELTAYAAAWRANPNTTPGGTASGSSSAWIPISYVTRAGLLWKGGEYYTVDPAINTPPLWWINVPADPNTAGGNPTSPSPADFGPNDGCMAEASLPEHYAPGTALTVTIRIKPALGTSAYAVEDRVPEGWTISAINEGGTFQSATRRVKWGPFLDDQERVLSYVATPTHNTAIIQTFSGIASFDGRDVPVAGRRVTAPTGTTTPPTVNTVLKSESGLPVFTFLGEVGKTYILECSTDLKTWIQVNSIQNSAGAMTFTDNEAPNQARKYYRVRLAP